MIEAAMLLPPTLADAARDSAIIGALASVVFFSFGFLAMAIVVHMRWRQEERRRNP
jgi:hypothetical protein